MRRRLIFILLWTLSLAGCAGGGAAPSGASAATAGPLTASGFVEASEVNIASEVSALIVEAVDEGAAAQAGQVVVRLDDALVRSHMTQAKAAQAAAEAALAQLTAGPRPDAVAAAQAEVAQARAELAGATQAISDTQAIVARPPGLAAQIAQALTQVKLAEQGVQKAKADLAEAEIWLNVYGEGTTERKVQEQKVVMARAYLAAAEADLSGARTYLGKLWEVQRFPADLVASAHAAESQAEVAQAKLTVAEAALAAARAGATREAVAVAQAEVDRAAAQAALVEAQLSRFVLKSPMDGVVTRRLAQAGEIARPGAPLLVVADLRQLQLVVYVPVTRVGEVTVGQPVEVRLEAYPGEVFPGAVERIAPQAEFRPGNIGSAEERVKLVFAVTLRVPNPDGRLKAGLPAEATFLTP